MERVRRTLELELSGLGGYVVGEIKREKRGNSLILGLNNSMDDGWCC